MNRQQIKEFIFIQHEIMNEYEEKITKLNNDIQRLTDDRDRHFVEIEKLKSSINTEVEG